MGMCTEVWFWILVVVIVGCILSLILFETMGNLTSSTAPVPEWIWAIFIVSLVLFLVAFILYCVQAYRKALCSTIKDIKNPYVAQKKVHCCTEEGVAYTVPSPVEAAKDNSRDIAQPMTKTVPINEAFSAASFASLSTLAPIPALPSSSSPTIDVI